MEIVQISAQKVKDPIDAFERYQSSLYPAEGNHPDPLSVFMTKSLK